nr:MerR family transcriptional regulator [Anaplasma phagocytophilum]
MIYSDLDNISDHKQSLDKVFVPIGTVAKEVGVEQYVLRFWESKFSQISPIKRRGRRLYGRNDIEIIKKIKHMLYDLGYTIKGAQAELKKQHSVSKVAKTNDIALTQLLENMLAMREMLTKKLNGM